MTKRIPILGISTVLWADEGFALRCVKASSDSQALPSQVRLPDGGTPML